MKLSKLTLLFSILIMSFSGCNSRTQNIQLRNINANQAHTIRQQKLIIDALQTRQGGNTVYQSNQNSAVPQAPKKEITLKVVEDENYSSDYMYPERNKKESPKVEAVNTVETTPTSTTSTHTAAMTKEECIGMIGAEKFAKYTKMFGSEASSLKRCRILKEMKN